MFVQLSGPSLWTLSAALEKKKERLFASCPAWRHSACRCKVFEHTSCAHLAREKERWWQRNLVEKKQIGGKKINLATAWTWSLVLTGLIQQSNPHVWCTDASGTSIYSLGRVLPGQRDGSLLWYKDLVKFLGNSSLKMVEHEAYPSMLRSANGWLFDVAHWWHSHCESQEDCPGRTHPFTASKVHSLHWDHVWTRWWGDVSEESTSTSWSKKDGHSNPFQAFGSACKLLHLSKRLQNKRSPGHSEIETPDNTEKLKSEDASVYRSCIGILCTCLQICHSASTWSDISQLVHQNPRTKRWWSWSTWLATWQVTLTNMSLWKGRACIQACFVTRNVKSLFLRSSVTQTGLQTETAEDRCLAAQFSMGDAWCTHHQGLKRSCHCRAQNRKHMLPLHLSWMPSSLGPFFVGYFKFAFSCICTSTHELDVEFCHVEVLDV